MDLFRFALHVVHQQILPKRIRRGEVRFAAADLRHALHELGATADELSIVLVDDATIAGAAFS